MLTLKRALYLPMIALLAINGCNNEEPAEPITDDIQCDGTFSENFSNLTETIVGSGNEIHKQFSENGTPKWYTSWWQEDGKWHYKYENVIYDEQIGKMKFRYNRNNSDAAEPYVSGEIWTGSPQDNKKFLYGTYEARIKVAKGSGVVNTFFGYYDEDPLPGNDHEVNKEIDIEIFGEEPTTWILFSCWLSHQSKTQKWFDTRTLGINDLSLGFHVYRFQWSPTEVKFYIDGCQAEVIETNVPQTGIPIATGLWVCQQLDLSCCWNSGLPCYPGFPLPTTNNSGEMVVDYVCITPGTLTPTQGLVAYYPFNGNANDESGNNNHGRVCGALSVQDRFGSPSQAYEFGASNDTIPLPASINITGSMSISFWVSTTMVDTGNWPFASFLVDRDICGYSRDWSVGLGHGGKIQFNTGMSNRDSVLTSAQDINTNSWNHVTVVRDATNGIKRIYINGVHDAAAPFDNQSFANNSRQIFLAASVCNTSTHHFFRGRMDDVRFYTRVISDAEIQQLYHEGGW